MKRLVFVLMISSLLCATAWAQMGGGMMQGEAPQSEEWECPQGMGPGWGMGQGMMGQGWGMGPGYGMMGPGWGMGQYGCGMMGPGWGMGRHGYGMMGPGWGMGQYGCGMMGPGWGMGHHGYGMMGPGYGRTGPEHGKKYQKFLDDTRDLRKALHMKRFEYFEAMRDPETTEETMTKLRDETRDLMKKIYEKAPWKQ